MKEQKCELGCKHFHGGEVRHHKDCVFYSGSFSELYDKLEAENKKLEKEIETLQRYLRSTNNQLANKGGPVFRNILIN